MPSSRPSTIPLVLHLLRQVRPRSILDVGVGFGKWGHLFREYTDINEAERDPARYRREKWQVRIDGIEGHAAYLTDMHRFLYNEIYVGDAAELLPKLSAYDLVFLGDIIEHLDKPRGEQMLRDAVSLAHKAVIVSTPKFETRQEDLCGNEFERHRSLWSARDFKKWAGARVKTVGGDTLVAVVPKSERITLSLAWPKRTDSTAAQQIRRARDELLRLIPLDEPFALVDEEQIRSTLPHRMVQPFPSRQGMYWGPPADAAAAIEEAERLRASGTVCLVFVASTFWWLHHYLDFARYLDEQWERSVSTDTLIVYRWPHGSRGRFGPG